MSILSAYEPKEVLKFFEEICSIPHGSGNVDQISDYLVKFAVDRGLKYRQDEAKNVIIWKEGTAGYENSAPVILQGHMDMVAVKDSDCEKNLETEGLDLEVVEVDGEKWISAKGTSLGGDDGIAVAMGLALLDSDTIPHPPLEVIATTDEEVGMDGAAALDCSDLKGRLFLNADSEDEGVFTVSCAGGMRANASVPYETEVKDGALVTVKLTGFRGGHSGVEINKGRLNANIVLGRVLNVLRKEVPVQLVSVSGGDKDNAIAVFSEAAFVTEAANVAAAKEALEKEMAVVREEYASVEKGLTITIAAEEQTAIRCMTKKSSDQIIVLLMNYINGIQRMNPDMADMVQTSLNLGILTTGEDAVVFSSALRSSSESEKEHLLERIRSNAQLFGGSVEISGNYPGWEFRPESLVRDTFVECYKEQYGKDPIVEGIHAGLECGLFSSKLPGLDCISYGPQMRSIHTTGELLSIDSTARTWELTKAVLAKLK